MKVQLTSHDVNAISVVVQQKNKLPTKYLIDFCEKASLSDDALDIVRLVLSDDFDTFGETLSNSKKKIKIADAYLNWAAVEGLQK